MESNMTREYDVQKSFDRIMAKVEMLSSYKEYVEVSKKLKEQDFKEMSPERRLEFKYYDQMMDLIQYIIMIISAERSAHHIFAQIIDEATEMRDQYLEEETAIADSDKEIKQQEFLNKLLETIK